MLKSDELVLKTEPGVVGVNSSKRSRMVEYPDKPFAVPQRIAITAKRSRDIVDIGAEKGWNT